MPSGSPTSGVGRVIAGRYQLLDRLGSGGMGHVWRAHDHRLACEVALKEVVLRGLAATEERETRVARARAEARHAAGLRGHPHVVTVHDVLEHDGLPWIVMEYVADAVDLRDLVARRGPLPPAECARVGLAVLDALTAGHRRGVLHRDVKPANILLAPDRAGAPYGRVLLTDYGISVQPDTGETRYTLGSGLVGTSGYLAPERATGGPPTPAADLFSLGCTLYYAVEGTGPFERASHFAEVTAVVMEEPRPPVRAGTLETVLRGLLAKDPAGRPDAAMAEAVLAGIVTPQAGDAYARARTETRSRPPWNAAPWLPGDTGPSASDGGPATSGSTPPSTASRGRTPGGLARSDTGPASPGPQTSAGPGPDPAGGRPPPSGSPPRATGDPSPAGLGPASSGSPPPAAGDPSPAGFGSASSGFPSRSASGPGPAGTSASARFRSVAARRRPPRPYAVVAALIAFVMVVVGLWYGLTRRSVGGGAVLPYGEGVGLVGALREGDCVLADWPGGVRFGGTPRLSLDPGCRVADGQVMALVAAGSVTEAGRPGCEERTREVRGRLADVRVYAVVPSREGFAAAGRRTACVVLGAHGPVYGPLDRFRPLGSAFADTANMQRRDCLQARSNRDARLVSCRGSYDELVVGFTRLGPEVTLAEARTASDAACARDEPPGDYGFDPSVFESGSWTSQGAWKSGTHRVVCTVRKQNGGTMEGNAP